MTNWRLSDIIRHVHEPDRSTRRTETNLLIILSTHFKLAHADWVGTSPIPTPTETLLRASPVFLLRLKLNGLARMLVPKMVKNGFNSVLQTSAGSRRLVAARNSGTMRSPKLSPNHKRRIKTILDQFRNKHAR
jgi:hypothetical protein